MYSASGWTLALIFSLILFLSFSYDLFNQFTLISTHSWWLVFRFMWIFEGLCASVIALQIILLLWRKNSTDEPLNDNLPMPTWPMIIHESAALAALITTQTLLLVDIDGFPSKPIPWSLAFLPADIYTGVYLIIHRHYTLGDSFTFAMCMSAFTFFILTSLQLDHAPHFPPVLLCVPLYVIVALILVSWVIVYTRRILHPLVMIAFFLVWATLTVAVTMATVGLAMHATVYEWPWIAVVSIVVIALIAIIVLLIANIFLNRKIHNELVKYMNVLDYAPIPACGMGAKTTTARDILIKS
jgi:hypothetical protein